MKLKIKIIRKMEEFIMIKTRLVKAFALGLCLSALSTGTAFAMEVSSPSSVGSEELSEELKVLYSKQAEIDTLLFKDHAKELEEKGIFVNYTGVNVDVIEIGISEYSDDKANFIYEIVGKDQVKVVAFDESIIYASGVAEPAVGDGTDEVVDPAVYDKGELYTTTVDPDTAVSDEDGTTEEKVYKDTDVQIQIESTEDVPEEDVIDYTTTDAEGAEVTDVKTVATTSDAVDDVKRDAEEGTNGMSAPMIVLAIAGGAALVGGSIMVANKKKNAK